MPSIFIELLGNNPKTIQKLLKIKETPYPAHKNKIAKYLKMYKKSKNINEFLEKGIK